jgi:hypothetical protein
MERAELQISVVSSSVVSIVDEGSIQGEHWGVGKGPQQYILIHKQEQWETLYGWAM